MHEPYIEQWPVVYQADVRYMPAVQMGVPLYGRGVFRRKVFKCFLA